MDMDIRNETQEIGPFHLDRKGSNVVIRSSQPFRYQVSLPQMQARKQGMGYISHAYPLVEGEKMILSTLGHDDVVIEGR